MTAAANALTSAREAPTKAREEPLVIDLPAGSVEAETISTLNRCNEATRAQERLFRAARPAILEHAESWWLARLLDGTLPDVPVKFRNPVNGDTVSWVVQDRTASADIDPAAAAELRELLGAKARGAVREETVYSFDAEVLAAPLADGSGTVHDLVGEAIAAALKKAVRAKRITQDQADQLVFKVTRRRLDPGFVKKLPKHAGDLETLRRCVRLLGSALVRFVRT